MSFESAVAFVLRPENDGQPYHVTPDDPGGATAYGWALRKHRDLTDAELRAMTPQSAAARYRRTFWVAIKGDLLPPAFHIPMFDTAVLEGPEAAIKFLQRALYVRDDGDLGPKTLNAVETADPGPVLERFTAERIFNLSQKGGWPEDGKGWTRRAVASLRR